MLADYNRKKKHHITWKNYLGQRCWGICVIIFCNYYHLITLLQNITIIRVQNNLAPIRCHFYATWNSIRKANQHIFKSHSIQLRPSLNVEFTVLEAKNIFPYLYIKLKWSLQQQQQQQQQQQHSLFSQASWGRLEMKPERNKFKDLYNSIEKLLNTETTCKLLCYI